nr:AP-4 complex subunit epsilon-1-like [Ciona intestinalis]|eukprot:XP_009859367.1 AP-4 complex subunit epsilon-1-like [Ciona intestinalis]
MSDVMSKSLGFAMEYIKGKAQSIDHPYTIHDFLSTVSKISNSKDEILVLSKFLQQMKDHFNICPLIRQRQSLVTLTYCCQMPGIKSVVKLLHDVAAVVITFVERAKSVKDKRLGYLALTTLADICDNEIVYLAVNTVVKDVASKSPAVITIALNCMVHIVSIDIIPVLLPIAEKRLSHSDGNVRAKSVMALHRMYLVGPEFVHSPQRHLKQALSDKDPEVMATVLPYVYDVLKTNPELRSSFAPKLVHILKQVVKNRLPMYMSRQGVPAPWVQINIMKSLFFCVDNLKENDSLANILIEILNRGQSLNNTASYSVVAECTHLISRLYDAKHEAFQTVLGCMGCFLHSKHPNLLLVGLQLLSELTTVDSTCCVQYQDIIINSLSHPDMTVKKQTLNLIRVLTNPTNYKSICSHMIEQLKETSSDKYFTSNFSMQIASTAEKFSTEEAWLLATLHSVLTSGGENVCPEACNKLQVCLGKASKSCIENEVNLCLKLLETSLSSVHLKLVVWVLGEYADYMVCENSSENVALICQCCLITFQNNKSLTTDQRDVVIFGILNCIVKMSAKVGNFDHEVKDMLTKLLKHTQSIMVHQKLKEFEVPLEKPNILKKIFTEEFQFDKNLSFLEDFISSSSIAPEEQSESIGDSLQPILKYEAYGHLQHGMVKTPEALLASVLPDTAQPKVTGFLSKKAPDKREAPRKWGQSGYLGVKEDPRPENSLSNALFGKSTSQTLNEALLNLSAVGNKNNDNDICDIMNDMMMTSQTTTDSGAAFDDK